MRASSFVVWLGRVLATLLFVCCTLCVVAQTPVKQIRMYHVVVKTNSGTVRGILERATPARMYVSARNGKYIALQAAEIRLVRIKEYPRKKRKVEIPLMEPGLTAYTSEGYLSEEYMKNAPSLAEDLGYSIVGMALTSAYGFIYNGLNNMDVFKINSDPARYKSLVARISDYAVFNQNLPDYEIELLKKGNR